MLQSGKNKYTKEATASEKLLQSVEAELKVCQDITEVLNYIFLTLIHLQKFSYSVNNMNSKQT